MQKSEQELKEIVKEKYSLIATQDIVVNASSCCGATPSSQEIYNIMSEDYTLLGGYNSSADLALGCGLPTEFAKIKQGDTVIDLGSGAGNDCFIARNLVGASGKIIGIDFTDSMIRKARENAESLGLNNVEFRQGDIDNMPVSDSIADVIVSNCVLNLVPNKQKVISEIFRVLKPGGHFSISDIVLIGDLPKPLLEDATMYAGCISGAIQKDVYLNYIKDAGFSAIAVQKEKVIIIPDDILSKYLKPEDIKEFKEGELGIFSITVFALKPGEAQSMQKNTSLDLSLAVQPTSSCC